MSPARAGLADRLPSWLPRGGLLPEDAWHTRHRGIVWLAAAHVPVLALVAAWRGAGVGSWAAVAAVALLAAGSASTRWSRTVRSSLATLSLLSSTALLIHLFGGLIELHFHFFVVVAVVALYQAWTPYLLGLGFVLGHHALMGLMMPMAVYNHSAAMAHPVLFACVHAGFVLAESVACLTYWKLNEQALGREREQRERAEASNRALETAHREISDLMAMVSHDLRGPLTVMNGNVELLLDSWDVIDDGARQQLVGRVATAGRSLDDMLNGTLTLSALDASGVQPRPSVFRIDDVVRQALDSTAQPLPGLDVSDLGPTTVLADRQHVLQVVANLVTNAGKYGAAPYALSSRSVDDAVELTLSDSGPGVPPEFVPRLFDRYSRSEVARRGRQRGTGLGLYIVRMLLEANSGEIQYAARPGGGGSFTVRLPRGPYAVSVVPDRVAEVHPEREVQAPTA